MALEAFIIPEGEDCKLLLTCSPCEWLYCSLEVKFWALIEGGKVSRVEKKCYSLSSCMDGENVSQLNRLGWRVGGGELGERKVEGGGKE